VKKLLCAAGLGLALAASAAQAADKIAVVNVSNIFPTVTPTCNRCEAIGK
jgi:hypothetical protein